MNTEPTFQQVVRDKQGNGIIEGDRVGYKKRSYLIPGI